MDALPVKAAKNGGGGCTVEAPVMKTETYIHRVGHGILAAQVDLQIGQSRSGKVHKDGHAPKDCQVKTSGVIH
jgi:hypothetical protein